MKISKADLVFMIISIAFIATMLFTGCGSGLNTMTIIKPKEIVAIKPAYHDSLNADTTHSVKDSISVFTKIVYKDGKVDTEYVAKYYPLYNTLTVEAPPESIKVQIIDTLMITTPAKVEKDSIWARFGYMSLAFILGGILVGAYIMKKK
jgi:hypothetical protein